MTCETELRPKTSDLTIFEKKNKQKFDKTVNPLFLAHV